jgi:hypothetical protein
VRFFFKYCFLEKGGHLIFETLGINWFISLEIGETSDLTDRQLTDCVWSTDVSLGSLDRWDTKPRELFLNGAINIFISTIDIFVKTPRIIFKVLNFECIILKSIVFSSFLLTSLRTKWNIKFCLKKNLFSHFLIGKIGGRLIFGATLYSVLYGNLPN